jgi:hypothetical protein
MRKSIITPSVASPRPDSRGEWFDLEQIASVEVTSENPSFPIESCFSQQGPGWRAAIPGAQIIRLVLDEPRSIRRIWLEFMESEVERTQEFTLRWSADPSGPVTEIVRQQWNFNPQGSTSEIEDYKFNLDKVSVLELTIKPDIGGGNALATLARWRVS